MGAKDPSNINAGEVGSTPSDTLNNVCSEETKDRWQNFFVLAVYSSAPSPPPKKTPKTSTFLLLQINLNLACIYIRKCRYPFKWSKLHGHLLRSYVRDLYTNHKLIGITVLIYL